MKIVVALLLSFMGLMGSIATPARASEPSPRIELTLGAGDGSPVDDVALQKILKIVGTHVERGEITQVQSDYGIEGELYLCLGFDWSTSQPKMVEPTRKKVLQELRAVPVAPGSGNQKSVEQVEKCTSPT